MNSLYTLTALTGREASATRTVVIGTVEFNWRVWMILVWSLPVAILTTAIAWPFIGQFALIMLPLVEGAAIWLFHSRTSSGLRLRTYQAMLDKRKATLDQFFLCGQPLDTRHDDFRVLMQNTVPAPRAEAAATGGSTLAGNDEPSVSVDAAEDAGHPIAPLSAHEHLDAPPAGRPVFLHAPPAMATEPEPTATAPASAAPDYDGPRRAALIEAPPSMPVTVTPRSAPHSTTHGTPVAYPVAEPLDSRPQVVVEAPDGGTFVGRLVGTIDPQTASAGIHDPLRPGTGLAATAAATPTPAQPVALSDTPLVDRPRLDRLDESHINAEGEDPYAFDVAVLLDESPDGAPSASPGRRRKRAAR